MLSLCTVMAVTQVALSCCVSSICFATGADYNSMVKALYNGKTPCTLIFQSASVADALSVCVCRAPELFV